MYFSMCPVPLIYHHKGTALSMHACVQSLPSRVNDPLLSCRGVVQVDVNLQDVDIDQCSTEGWFAGTHRCNLTTMEVSVCADQTGD